MLSLVKLSNKSKMIALAGLFTSAMALSANAADYDYSGGGSSMQSLGPWAGLYGGVHLGYTGVDFDTISSTPQSSFEIEANNVSGGLFGGYNWQFNQLVLGVEGDVTFMGVDESDVISTIVYDTGMNFNLSARGRVGWAFNMLHVYGTLGASWTEMELTRSGASDESSTMGLILGAGAEAKLTQTLFLRGEYLYADYSEQSFNINNDHIKIDPSNQTLRVGIGMKF